MKTFQRYQWILILLLIMITGESSAKKLYADEFFAVIKEKQDSIDLIHQGIENIGEYLDFDNTMENARQTDNPQCYIDLTVARYQRMMCVMNNVAAQVAAEITDFLIEHQEDGVISPVAMEEGIAKYRSMTIFFVEHANEAQEEFENDWAEFVSRYGNIGEYVLKQDNDYMLLYGVDINR